MVSMELIASVDALSEADRIELLVHIESTLGPNTTPTEEQQVVSEHRVREMNADPALGLTIDEAIAAARRLTA